MTPKVQYVEITADHAGQRIDNFLMTRLKGVPKTRIYRSLRQGEVRVNKGRIKADYRLQTGDTLRLPPLKVITPASTTPLSSRGIAFLLEHILYEDERLLVLNKPAGMAVHGGVKQSYAIIDGLRQARADLKYLELVHRLDKETSGCLLLAKKAAILRELHELLREGLVEKHYVTLVKGHWQGHERVVDAPLQKTHPDSGGHQVRVHHEGKLALTRFMPQRVGKTASLLAVKLETGRTHQIRVHAAHIGYPVAGDSKYGDFAFNREIQKQGLRRLFLHASHIQFTLASTQRSYAFDAPLPQDLTQCLEQLSWD